MNNCRFEGETRDAIIVTILRRNPGVGLPVALLSFAGEEHKACFAPPYLVLSSLPKQYVRR